MSWPEIPDMIMDTSVAVFGEPCILRPLGGGEFAFDGIFDNKYMVYDPQSGMKIATSVPNVAFSPSLSIPTMKKNDVIEVRGKTYKVKELKQDDQGESVALLYV